MGVRVCKYGGSSVADTDKLLTVATRVAAVRESGDDVVVVVSAMGGTTYELLSLARKVSDDPDRRELDMLLSVGERISMTLLAMAVKDLGYDAVSFTGSQSGIITNDAHTGARIIDVRPFRLQDELARGRVVIVAGYQGVSYRKEVTTLGRGGSDTTAVALAAALGAEVCEIWSDVDGVYSADPRVVLDARKLQEVSYEHMQELARAGAAVLNADAVQFAKDAGIALHARSTFSPERRGTQIRQIHTPSGDPVVIGVAGATDRRLINSSPTPHAIPPDARLIASLGDTTVIAPGTAPLPGDLGHPIGTATAVCAHPDTTRPAALAALASLSPPIEVRGELTSACSLTFLVDPDQVDASVCALHAALVSQRSDG